LPWPKLFISQGDRSPKEPVKPFGKGQLTGDEVLPGAPNPLSVDSPTPSGLPGLFVNLAKNRHNDLGSEPLLETVVLFLPVLELPPQGLAKSFPRSTAQVTNEEIIGEPLRGSRSPFRILVCAENCCEIEKELVVLDEILKVRRFVTELEQPPDRGEIGSTEEVIAKLGVHADDGRVAIRARGAPCRLEPDYLDADAFHPHGMTPSVIVSCACRPW
jgi:hypothetical protein